MEYLKGGRGLIIGLVLGLVLAGSSTAVAAGLITSKQIKNGTIKLVDLAPGLRQKIAASGPGAMGPAGPVGPVGPVGPQGAPGEKGPAGVFSAKDVTTVDGPPVSYPIPFPGGSVPQSNATCPEGSVAISGFYQMVGLFRAEPTPFVSSYRQPDPRIWSVNIMWPNTYVTTDIGNPTYRAVAICAKAE